MISYKLSVSAICMIVLTSVSGCSDKGGDIAPAVAPKAAEVPLLDLEVISISELGGTVLLVVTSDGKLIHKSQILSDVPQVYKSRGLVAYTFRDQGLRLKTINTLGDVVPTEAQLLDERSKVLISDNIIAFTANTFTIGKLIEERKDGQKVYESSAAGRRLFAFNKSGKALSTAVHLLDGLDGELSKIQISNKLIAFTGIITQQGKLLRQDGDSKVFEAIPAGTRLFTYTEDGRTLSTASVVFDGGTEVRILDSAVIMKDAPQFTQGKLLKEENGSKTYESLPAGRKTLIFNYDGSVAS